MIFLQKFYLTGLDKDAPGGDTANTCDKPRILVINLASVPGG